MVSRVTFLVYKLEGSSGCGVRRGVCPVSFSPPPLVLRVRFCLSLQSCKTLCALVSVSKTDLLALFLAFFLFCEYGTFLPPRPPPPRLYICQSLLLNEHLCSLDRQLRAMQIPRHLCHISPSCAWPPGLCWVILFWFSAW